MKFEESSDQAADFLRQAVPKMVKHNIVPNPLNYTLWYSYYSNVFPELNKELDQTIERYGTCPPKIAERLFIKYITRIDGEEEEKLAEFHKSFENLVSNLSASIGYTAKQSGEYSDAIKHNILALEEHELDESVSPVLTELNANASAIVDVTGEFKDQLSAAEKEINTLKESLEKSQKEANTDPLTGLSNRRVFESKYNKFFEQPDAKNSMTLIMMDIDRFKAFNDTHGHLLGDQILKYVGELLRQECPNAVTPVRFGGEEFAMLCPNYDLDQGVSVAEKIRGKLETVPFYNKKTGVKIPPITASFGVATKKQDESLDDIIHRADQALYGAKDAGRNQVKVAH